jgi:hypothetical protein
VHALRRLTIIFSLHAFVLTLSISTPIAAEDVIFSKMHPAWLSSLLPDSEIPAKYVTTTLLPQLIGSDDQLRQRLGFSSLAQINNHLLLDPPFVVIRVGLKKLTSFNPSLTLEGQFSPFLEKENWFEFSSATFRPVRYLFPIRESSRPPLGCTPPSLVDPPAVGCIASSVQVKRLLVEGTGKWEFQQIGRPGLIKRLTQFGDGHKHFVVWIPVLNLHYLARVVGHELMIKAIAKDRYVKTPPNYVDPFKAGEELPGNEVFEQLKKEVQVHQIDPSGPPG